MKKQSKSLSQDETESQSNTQVQLRESAQKEVKAAWKRQMDIKNAAIRKSIEELIDNTLKSEE